MEHAFLSRINAHLDDIEAYPDTMLAFRAHLSTQDAMLQIKHQVLDNKTRGTRAILGLDLKKAFDNAAHAAILRKMATLNLGNRAYNYVKDFLTNGSISLTLGKLASEDSSMGSVGAPQGSVISPMLFNLVMIGLLERLNAIEGVHHAIYADDITIWVCEGSDGEIEQRLQTAVEVVEQYLVGTGLVCSPEKSELLLYRPTLKGRPPKCYIRHAEHEYICVRTKEGHEIPRVKQITMLGLIIESNGANGATIRNLETKITNTMRLIRRITNRHRGMKETSVVRLIHSFVISRITYVAVYHNWYTAEKAKLNTLIRRTHKMALGLPDSPSTELLLQLGIHNTLEDLIEAQQISELERLTRTRTGRSILDKLEISYHKQHGDETSLPSSIREKLQVASLPNNMHPGLNQGRRARRNASEHLQATQDDG
ncbi:uncharacterized protein LOC119391623 [Rhipicephalus sanguineus]|uniref:uncharacterized protein LOC119391623 n=1 Tax=Rhipicephalus sanguineus TaxID=34632 RepID=UPI0018946840|nr:uncharacterized protein LOC119391623 [Rhipicephalus sanguineus]